jgi:hypothetical protein
MHALLFQSSLSPDQHRIRFMIIFHKVIAQRTAAFAGVPDALGHTPGI